MKYRYGYINPRSSPRLTPKSSFLKRLEAQQKAAQSIAVFETGMLDEAEMKRVGEIYRQALEASMTTPEPEKYVRRTYGTATLTLVRSKT